MMYRHQSRSPTFRPSVLMHLFYSVLSYLTFFFVSLPLRLLLVVPQICLSVASFPLSSSTWWRSRGKSERSVKKEDTPPRKTSMTDSLDDPRLLSTEERASGAVIQNYELLPGFSTELLYFSKSNLSSAKVCFVVLPGNPGAVHFYEEYMAYIYDNFNKEMDCVSIGHLGHSVTSISALSSAGQLSEGLGTKEQTRNAVRGLKLLKALNPNVKFILAGHSVGAYICVEVLKKFSNSDSILKVFCLFPTLHHIGSTPNGHTLFPMLSYFRHLAADFVRCFQFLPRALQLYLVERHLANKPAGGPSRVDGNEEERMRASVSRLAQVVVDAIAHPQVALNCLSMGYNEMIQINDFDGLHLSNVAAKLLFYFAQRDDWVTHNHVHDLLVACPQSTFIFCQHGYPHAFVMKESRTLSDLSSEWIRTTLATACVELKPSASKSLFAPK